MDIIGIIVPCYNEYYRLEKEKITTFLTQKLNYHICFVNNGSTDKTSQLLKEFRKTNPDRIHVIDLDQKQPKATAFWEGVKYLTELNFINTIGLLDENSSTSLEVIHSLVEKLYSNPQASLVFDTGNAIASKNSHTSNFIKLFIYFTVLAFRFVLQLPFKKSLCGAKVFKKDVIENICDKRFLNNWLFSVEVFLRLKKRIGIKDLHHCINQKSLDSWIAVAHSTVMLKNSFIIPLIPIWGAYVNMRIEESFKKKHQTFKQIIFKNLF